MRGDLSRKKAALTLKRQDFLQFLCFWKTGSGTETKTFPKSEPESQQIITVPQYCLPDPYLVDQNQC
jgi:hypothetical protein